MDGILRPSPEGLRNADTVLDENGFVQKYELSVGVAKNLQGHASEYAFFTPAILYLYGRFRDAPLADFVYMACPDAKFYFKRFDRPVFRGLEARSNGNPDWNHVLWAIRGEHWKLFSDWMVSVTLTYSDTGSVAGIGEQRFTVIDPLAAAHSSVWHGGLPRIEVSAFGLNGDKVRVGLEAKEPLWPQPSLTFSGPDAAMRVFSQALYGGSNPVDAKADYAAIRKGDSAS